MGELHLSAVPKVRGSGSVSSSANDHEPALRNIEQPAADDTETEVVSPADPRFGIVSIDSERMRGTPCFAGTRVPIVSLFDHLASGVSLDEFLLDFPGVPRDVCVSGIRVGYERVAPDLIDADRRS